MIWVHLYSSVNQRIYVPTRIDSFSLHADLPRHQIFLPTLHARLRCAAATTCCTLARACTSVAAAARTHPRHRHRARLFACLPPPPLGRDVPIGRPATVNGGIFFFVLINVFRLFRVVFNIFRFSIGVVFSIFWLIR
jgi:hypothetical protein